LKVAVHQPHYFPYPGFFHKVSIADLFVIMDDVQYDRGFINRNRILDVHGPLWLTVPINKAQKFMTNSGVEINNGIAWREEHWKKIRVSYANAKFFHLYREYLADIYSKNWTSIFQLDLETTTKVFEWLNIRVPVLKESELKVTSTSTQRLVDVCKAVGADTYVSGRGGKDYMDEPLFYKNGISIQYQSYAPAPYPQRFSGAFVPDLSILDMLANVGPESANVISRSTQGATTSNAEHAAGGEP
jgi:WbqC-like protein family